jgi:TonB family protein
MRRAVILLGMPILAMAAAPLIANAQRVIDTPGGLIQRKVFPLHSYEARNKHLAGSGLVLLNVDSRNGYVTSVRMLKSTGQRILDDAATDAYRQWRFKPGTLRKVRIPVLFTMQGVSY